MEYDPIKKYYVNACSAIIKKLYPELTLSPTGNSHEPVQELVVEYPDSRQGYGDIALPCFFLSKKLKKPPFQIAKEIAHACSQSLDELGVLQATAIGGYVNFSIAPQFLLSCYQEFSLRPFKQKNERVLVEYSSPNANKPLHLGHVRNNALGMSISLLLERIGYEVIRVMLVNDKGVGVAKTIYAYQKTGRKQPPKKPDHYIGDLYVAAEGLLKDEPHANQIIQQLIAGWEKNDPVIRDDWKKLRNWVMEGFFKTYQDYGCTFDIIYYESEIYQEADEILKEGINKGVFKKEQNGALVAILEPEYPNKVILRADGTSLYITTDLILAKKKAMLNINRSIYVVAHEQELYFQQLFAILKKLGYPYADHCYHFSYGMVMLPEGKMKSREGNVIDADDIRLQMIDLAKEEIYARQEQQEIVSQELVAKRAETIGMAGLLFYLLKVDPKKDILFNPKESISFDGETGPYIQYAATRINSIIKKAQEQGLKPIPLEQWYTQVQHHAREVNHLYREEKPLLLEMLKYHQILYDAATQLRPSHFALYLLSLAQRFNEYYHQVPILKASGELKLFRLSCIAHLGMLLEDGLSLLTIKIPEKM